jgi:replication factor A1
MCLLQSLNSGMHPILALKNAKIGDFNGRTLSTTSATTLTIDPDVPEAGRLRHW